MPPYTTGRSKNFNAASTVKVQPNSIEAEKAILGAILIDPIRSMDLCSEVGITEESFWSPDNKRIFACASSLYAKGIPIDFISISNELRKAGAYDEIGGSVALEQLISAVTSVGQSAYYATLLHEKEVLRKIISVSHDAEEKCYSPDRSVELILSETEQAVLSISENQKSSIPTWRESIFATIKRLDGLLGRSDGLSGISTGFIDLDNILQGLRPSEMIVLAARPSMGKTSLAMNICENVAMGKNTGGQASKRHPVAIFSLEMSTDALVTRMLCSKSGISSHSLVRGFCDKKIATTKLTRAADELNDAPIYVDDTGGLDIMDLRARARRMKKKYGIELIMIDYLQLLNSRAYASQGRQLETSNISAQIKSMAKELDVPVIVLSQLSRNPEQRSGGSSKPKLSDLRDSGAIEQDADVVLMLRRPSRMEDSVSEDERNLAIVDIAKNRNGPVGEAKLTFVEEYTRFENRTTSGDRGSSEF